MIKRLASLIKNKKITNVFGTDFVRNALISYIVYPLRTGQSSGHNNQLEIKSICAVFNKLGYNVDVVFYLSNEYINYSKYDIIFGFGKPFVNSFAVKKPLTRILYCTGSYPVFQNTQTLKRAKEVYKKTATYMIDSCRLADPYWPEQYVLSDAAILLGNNTTKKTYNEVSIPIFTLNAFYHPGLPKKVTPRPIKEVSQKQSFLYFTSNGAIHRGLDILLEFFAQHQEYQLHIASKLGQETSFLHHYQPLLSKTNIHYHDRVPLLSTALQELIDSCAFCILPSCSEGQSTSIVNLSSCGLIPIITKNCGLDLENKSITINDVSADSVAKAVAESQSLSLAEIHQKQQKLIDVCHIDFALEKFEQKLEHILKRVIR